MLSADTQRFFYATRKEAGVLLSLRFAIVYRDKPFTLILRAVARYRNVYYPVQCKRFRETLHDAYTLAFKHKSLYNEIGRLERQRIEAARRKVACWTIE